MMTGFTFLGKISSVLHSCNSESITHLIIYVKCPLLCNSQDPMCFIHKMFKYHGNTIERWDMFSNASVFSLTY